MKNLVRAFVLTLVATGAVASLHATSASSTTDAISASMTSKASMPVPTCPPDDPNGCGIGATGSSSSGK